MPKLDQDPGYTGDAVRKALRTFINNEAPFWQAIVRAVDKHVLWKRPNLVDIYFEVLETSKCEFPECRPKFNLDDQEAIRRYIRKH